MLHRAFSPIRCKPRWALSRVSRCSVRMADSPRRRLHAVALAAQVDGAAHPAVSVAVQVLAAVTRATAAAAAVVMVRVAAMAVGKQTAIVRAAKRTATARSRVQAALLAARVAAVRLVRLPWAAAMAQVDARQTAVASAPGRAAVKVRPAPVRKVMAGTRAALAAAALARHRATGRADAKGWSRHATRTEWWACGQSDRSLSHLPVKFSTMTLAAGKARQKRDECLRFAL